MGHMQYVILNRQFCIIHSRELTIALTLDNFQSRDMNTLHPIFHLHSFLQPNSTRFNKRCSRP
jgi:hypothetical protein